MTAIFTAANGGLVHCILSYEPICKNILGLKPTKPVETIFLIDFDNFWSPYQNVSLCVIMCQNVSSCVIVEGNDDRFFDIDQMFTPSWIKIKLTSVFSSCLVFVNYMVTIFIQYFRFMKSYSHPLVYEHASKNPLNSISR